VVVLVVVGRADCRREDLEGAANMIEHVLAAGG
jgi:hypothetical protein